MPNYEYRCLACKRKFEIFLSFADYGKKAVQCTRCGSDQVTRKIGKVRVARSTAARLENLADPSNLDSLEDDPRALGKMMREMQSEVGENMGPMFDEVVHRLEKGQTPDDIERDLPDLADEGGDFGGGMDSLGGSLDD